MKYFILLLTLTTIISCNNDPKDSPELSKYGAQMERALDELEAEEKEEERAASNAFKWYNESIVLEFRTMNNKRLTVSRDLDNNYLVYRFGTEDNIELQFPEKLDKTSFKKFDYSSYMRPGGKENLGMSLDYLSFVNEGFRYVIYKTYAAESVGNEDAVGVKIIDLKTKKETEIQGDFKTFSGGFPEEVMSIVNQSEELYD